MKTNTFITFTQPKEGELFDSVQNSVTFLCSHSHPERLRLIEKYQRMLSPDHFRKIVEGVAKRGRQYNYGVLKYLKRGEPCQKTSTFG